ncbi:hypothetical protein [Pontibacter anaerobius]|uniref:EF-hand domain-containing protein n=1 Tax=Pontibacter anaerobius TaxID=2993940 RepID=A0ABT3RGT2_9BACT|nr:hypothetical protein [Pontibacter anaerobius]MCX2740832.1 hypothetical protein [Pontibacter anaerobius]
MKIIYLASLFLLSVTFVSCDGDGDDDDPTPVILDTVAPEVTMNEPTADDSVVVIDMLVIFAEITDNWRLDNVRVVLTEPGGASRVLSDVSVTSFQYELIELHQIPKNAATGDYTLTVEAKDKELNVTKESVTFVLHASDINNAAFANAFHNALFYSKFTEGLNEFGYSPWDYGYSYDELWLSTVVHFMVSTDEEFSISEAEWNRFIADFNVQNQSWAKWDENSDASLDDIEFRKGLSSLNFFDDWDKDQDSIFSPDEMADGIFSRWDLNNDDMLSRQEYQEKFYTYLYRE